MRNQRTKEKCDDLMPNRHSSQLQEMSGILILPLKTVIGDYVKEEKTQMKQQEEDETK